MVPLSAVAAVLWDLSHFSEGSHTEVGWCCVKSFSHHLCGAPHFHVPHLGETPTIPFGAGPPFSAVNTAEYRTAVLG